MIQLYGRQQNPNCEECRCYALLSLSLFGLSGAHFEKNGDSLKKERRRDAAAANCSDKADFIASRFTAHSSLRIGEVARIP